MKLLIHSNAPWVPTGYGAQVRIFAPRLLEHREVAVSAFYGLEGSRLNWEGLQVFPGIGGDYGGHTVLDHARRYFGGDPRDGIVLTLMDVWVLEAEVSRKLNMACWVPVDHEPAPPRVTTFLEQSGAIPVAMSRFGESKLREAGFDPLYVPHGVSPEYRQQDKAAAREKAGVDPEAFLVGVVAANKGAPSRKCFQEILQAFALFHQEHPEAILYLHTIIDANYAGGEDLGSIMLSLNLTEGSVMIADQYRMAFDPLSPETMADVYSTFDVLLHPSAGEGFGIPVVEAQACGVPAIVTDFSAMTETCGAGWKIGWRPRWSQQGAWQAAPDVLEIVSALEEAHGLSKSARQKLEDRAMAHARQYAADHVTERYLLPALEAIEERVADRAPAELEVAA